MGARWPWLAFGQAVGMEPRNIFPWQQVDGPLRVPASTSLKE